jgi:hypothetical protein
VLRCDLPEFHRCRGHRVVEGEEPDDQDPQLVHLAYCTPATSLPDVVDAWLRLGAVTPSKPPGLPRQPLTPFDVFTTSLGELQPRPRHAVQDCAGSRAMPVSA